MVLERRTNPATGLQWFELEPQALKLLNLPSYFDQQKFRLLDDLASSTTAIDCFRPCRTPGTVLYYCTDMHYIRPALHALYSEYKQSLAKYPS